MRLTSKHRLLTLNLYLKMKSLIAALSLFIPLVSASVPQDVLGIINVNSTCGEIRATSMS